MSIIEIQGRLFEKQPVADLLTWCSGCVNEDRGMEMCHAFPKCSDMNASGEWVKFYIFKEITQ
jgi:hypothetical protein